MADFLDEQFDDLLLDDLSLIVGEYMTTFDLAMNDAETGVVKRRRWLCRLKRKYPDQYTEDVEVMKQLLIDMNEQHIRGSPLDRELAVLLMMAGAYTEFASFYEYIADDFTFIIGLKLTPPDTLGGISNDISVEEFVDSHLYHTVLYLLQHNMLKWRLSDTVSLTTGQGPNEDATPEAEFQRRGFMELVQYLLDQPDDYLNTLIEDENMTGFGLLAIRKPRFARKIASHPRLKLDYVDQEGFTYLDHIKNFLLDHERDPKPYIKLFRKLIKLQPSLLTLSNGNDQTIHQSILDEIEELTVNGEPVPEFLNKMLDLVPR